MSITRKRRPRIRPTAPLLLASDDTLARMLDIGRTTVWDWVQKGLLPPPAKYGGATRWNVRAVEAALGLSLDAPADEPLRDEGE